MESQEHAYLSDDEVHLVLDKWFELFPYLGLNNSFALALLVRRTLADASSYKSVSLVSHLSRYATGCVVDLLTLATKNQR